MVTSNECKLTRETVCMPMQIPEAVQEQSVELDYVLPDYYPDFFRLLHCAAEPSVLQWECRDGVLHYVCCVKLRIWYCAEQSTTVQCVTQRLEYAKQLTLPPDCDPAALRVKIIPATAYLNCRAINSRRIDVRGAVRMTIRMTCETLKEVLCDVSGLHTQCRKIPVTYLSKIVRTQKCCTLNEEISLSDTQPPLLSLLRDTVQLSISETRCIAGKLVVKGEAAVELLYTAQGGIETLRFSIPFSQIVEPDGLEDTMTCIAEAETVEHIITTEADASGDIRLIRCELQIRLLCEAMRASMMEPVIDLYSTVHPAAVETETVTLRALPVAMQETLRCKTVLKRPESVIDKVYAVWAEPKNLTVRADDAAEQMVLCGELVYFVMAADAEGEPLLLTETELLNIPLSMAYACGQSLLGTPMMQIRNCSYTLTSSDAVSVQTELLLSGQCMGSHTYTLATDAQINSEQRLSQSENYALRLYFGQEEESLWEIAKRFHTSVSAIMEENDCDSDRLATQQMLLIPIVL